MQNQNFGKLNIIVAVWGLKTVTEHVTNLIAKGTPETLEFKVNNKTIGEDGWPGQLKSFLVVYNYDGGELQVATAKEDEVIIINPDKITKNNLTGNNSFSHESLTVLAASYGPFDVTNKVKQLISDYNTLSFTVDNTTFADSWYGVAKTLVIVIGHDNIVTDIEFFVERENCYIDLNDVIAAI